MMLKSCPTWIDDVVHRVAPKGWISFEPNAFIYAFEKQIHAAKQGLIGPEELEDRLRALFAAKEIRLKAETLGDPRPDDVGGFNAGIGEFGPDRAALVENRQNRPGILPGEPVCEHGFEQSEGHRQAGHGGIGQIDPRLIGLICDGLDVHAREILRLSAKLRDSLPSGKGGAA
jgi:hypothetical protein